MKQKSRIHQVLLVVYFIVFAIGILATMLKVGYGADKVIGYVIFGLLCLGIVFLLESKLKAESLKETDAWVYGILSVAAYVGAFILTLIY